MTNKNTNSEDSAARSLVLTPTAPRVIIHNGNWKGPWAVAWECGCASDPEGSVDSMHYIYGPYPTRQSAEEYARSIAEHASRKIHVFPLWPAGNAR